MKPLRFIPLYVLCLSGSLPFLSSFAQAEDSPKATEVKAQSLQGVRFIKFVNDQLTVKVKDVSLQEVLEEVARQAGIALVLSNSLEERITIEFHQLPLEEGLHRIMPQRNFAVEYSTTSEESPSTVQRPKALWVFSREEEGSPPQTTLGDDGKGRASSQDGGGQISRLQAALTREDPSEREEAVESLGETGSPEAVLPLRSALKDEDEDVREAAIAALAEIGGDEAAQALVIALQDEDSSVRQEAVEALIEIGSDEAAHALATALQDQDAEIREAAVQALGEIGGESAIRLLEQALTDENESVREAAAEVLKELRDQVR